jgi:hypothetical protein
MMVTAVVQDHMHRNSPYPCLTRSSRNSRKVSALNMGEGMVSIPVAI